MVRLQLLLRSFSTINKSVIINQNLYICSTRLFGSKSNKDDDIKKQEKMEKNEKSLDKLNLLLQQMVQDDTKNTNIKKLNLAKPKNQRSEPGADKVKSETIEKQIVNAVKDVAEVIGGNKKQTESELLSKLLNPMNTEAEPNKNISLNLSDIVKGMKIDRDTKAPEAVSRAQQVKQLLDRVNNTESDRPRRRPQMRDNRNTVIETEAIDLFGSEASLGVFEASKQENVQISENATWQRLYQRELKLAITHPPANYFQQMILWTEQGKVWKFPIDNEQGMEDEQNVYFTEHVFLDKHLESWCPSRGPVRHFMELVCVGLSKNPYMSVTDKRDHIDWFKTYFEDKKKLLKDVGAIPTEIKTKVIKS